MFRHLSKKLLFQTGIGLLVVFLGFGIYLNRTTLTDVFITNHKSIPTNANIATPTNYVDAAGATVLLLSQGSLIGKRPVANTLQSNICKPSTSYSSTNYSLADIDSTSTWNGVLRIDSTSLTDSNSNGIPETSLLASGKLGFDQNGVLVEGVTVNPRTQFKCIFVTTSTYSLSGIGGLSGADAKCNSAATTAGLSGTYKAYMWSGTSSPASRMSQSTIPYKLPSGTQIASSWSGLTALGVVITENNNAIASSSCGTSYKMAFIGNSNVNCNGWIDTSGSYTWNQYNLPDGFIYCVSSGCGAYSCNPTCLSPADPAHIVCVEQ